MLRETFFYQVDDGPVEVRCPVCHRIVAEAWAPSRLRVKCSRGSCGITFDSTVTKRERWSVSPPSLRGDM